MTWTPGNVSLVLADVAAVLERQGLVVARQGTAAARTGCLRTDSRAVAPGDIFLAYKGVAADGHAHLATAAGCGACLLILEDPALAPGASVPWIQVTSGRAAWAYLAAHAFGNPQASLTLIGVTGTNGKSSTVWMTGELLRAAGIPCLTLGTLGAFFGTDAMPTRHTTPDPDVLFGMFAEAVRRGIGCVVMEVSSHAIGQEKVLPLTFRACAFTSFSRDHLDFHPTLDDYWSTKWRLFTDLAADDALRVFCDGLPRPLALNAFRGETVVYGLDAPVRATAWGARDYLQLTAGATGFGGTDVELTTKKGQTRGFVPYFARHALENFTAAAALTAAVLGRLPEPAFWAKLQPVPGRLEQVHASAGKPQVVVDYAHTPDALEKTLGVLRPLCRGRLSVVFGCGGDRDRGKRPLMGRIAEANADRVYVTSDNPRTEEPERILADIAAGMNGKPALVEADRAAAIARAVADAGVDDMVLIAGKGHETYQILATGRVDFDDREVARACLQ